jgi:hypothetical protein
MLSNATFDGIEVVGNGTRVGYNAGAGLDINLKRGDYSNITIMNSTIADNGDAGATFGGGLTIKARDDAPSYNGDPATLDGVWVHHNEVYGNSPDGIRLGEPGKTNLGPTDAHVYRNSITDNDGNGLENASTPETDGTCNWWGDSSGPGGAGSGTGDEVSTNVDFAEWLVSDDLDGDCIGGLSMGRKHTVRDQLETKQAGADEKDAKRIEKAIEHINKSLNPDYWDDATHLDPDQGKKVFDEEKKAVEELTRVKNTNVSTEILEIVDIDRDLAQTAYNEASPGAEKTKAQQELAKGDADAANQKYASAIEHYKKAWEHAIKAG